MSARTAQEIEQRRAQGLPVESPAGALSDERREQLEDVAPSWCPSWPVAWQRALHLVRLCLEAGGELPADPRRRPAPGRGPWPVGAVGAGIDGLLMPTGCLSCVFLPPHP